MKGFDFRARYIAAKKANGKAAINVMNLIIITGSRVLPIEEGKEKGTGKEKNYFSR